MAEQNNHLHVLRAFASLHWYEETIKFVFTFVAKTSELLLAAGIVISTANFFPLTALLATVAGLITHFDALGHATGLPVTDVRISGIIPVWVMTALRAVAVIGFLLASRLKEVSLQHLRQEWSQEALPSQEQCQQQVAPRIDYQALASALVGAMQQAGVVGNVSIIEEKITSLPSPAEDTGETIQAERVCPTEHGPSPCSVGQTQQEESVIEESAEMKITRAYEALTVERAARQESKPISARELAQRAKVRRSTCSEWLQQQGACRLDASGCQDEKDQCMA